MLDDLYYLNQQVVENSREEHILSNGRIYITDLSSDGSYRICVPNLYREGQLTFVDYSPNKECLDNFLKAATRLSSIDDLKNRAIKM